MTAISAPSDALAVPARPEPLPPTSLIICTRDRPALLSDTLTSVLGGDERPAEIVVVDQSAPSVPLTPHMPLTSGEQPHEPGACQIRHVPSTTAGLCRARNIGIAHARFDHLIFIDDDMFVAQDWFGTLVRALITGGERTVVTGRVLPADESQRGGFVPSLALSTQPRVYTGRLMTDVLAAGHMALHRSVVRALGPFDEDLGAGTRFPASDDNDYGYRLLEEGYHIRYVPEAVLFHRAWRRTGDYWRMRWSYGRGKGGFYTKHMRSHGGHMLRRLISDVSLRLVRFPWRFIHRPRLALGDLPYVAGVLSGAVDWTWIHRKAK